MRWQPIQVIVVGGRRTSVRLERPMWEALHDIAARQHRSIHDLVTEIDRDRTLRNLTAAIRVFVVEFYRGALMRVEADEQPDADAKRTSRGARGSA